MGLLSRSASSIADAGMRQGEPGVHAQEVAEKLSDRVPRLL